MQSLIRRTTSVWEKEEGFSVLLALLVGALFVAPLLRDWLPVLAAAGTALLVLLFIVGAIVLARNAWAAVAVSFLAGTAVALEMVYEITGTDSFAPWRLAAAGLTMALFTTVTLRRVFAPGPVTTHRLVGAVVAFLLAGLTFAYAYDWLEVLRPGSFHVAAAPRPGSYPTLLYYSFVTLTTVGYGDVTPLSSAARALSNIESLVGVLYPAILIGRLISKEIAGGSPPSRGDQASEN